MSDKRIHISIPEFNDGAKFRHIRSEAAYRTFASDLARENTRFSHGPERYPALQIIGETLEYSHGIVVAVAYLYDFEVSVK
jgi:hypothetical protein